MLNNNNDIIYNINDETFSKVTGYIERIIEEEVIVKREFSKIISEAKHFSGDQEIQNRFSATDLDYILTVKDDPKAIIEIKTPQKKEKGDVDKVPLSQFSLLRKLSRKLGIPVYYIIRYSSSEYRVIKCKFNEKEYHVDSKKQFVNFDETDGETVDKETLVRFLSRILMGLKDSEIKKTVRG